MECRDACLAQQPQEEDRDVRISDHRLGVACKTGEVHPVEDPVHPVAAAEAPDSVDVRVGQGAIQVGKTLIVGARQVPVGAAGVRTDHGLVPQRPAEFGAAGAVIALQQRAGGGNEGDAGALPESRWKDQLGRHSGSGYD